MKMNIEVRSHTKLEIKEILVQSGEVISSKQILLKVKEVIS
jgi:biotin carboxyl carrier protein